MQKTFLDFLQNRAKVLVSLALLAVSCHVSAEIIFGEYGSDEEDETPKEVKIMPLVLPEFPKEDNLLSFQVSPTQTQTFFIDATSLSVGEDEIRYTMVTKSQAGATNVSYEGIRCGTFEFRRDAYGHRDNKWVMSKNETWRPINFYAANRPRAVLTQEYFCDGKGIAGSNEDMIFRIRYNRSLFKNKYTGSSF